MNAKLSVIMPAYNAAKYIERSMESVLSQSHRELELIIVNDGSADDTAEVVSRVAERDSRVRLITVENGGPAMARNHGLDSISADSDYVMFIDADDELLPGALDYALNAAAECSAKLVIFGFTILSADGARRDYFEPECRLDESSLGQALPKLYMANMLNQVWAKLFSAELLRDKSLRFPDYRWGEDRLFIFDCLERTQDVAVLPGCCYLYVMHPGESLITRYYDKKHLVCCLADKRMAELCQRFGTVDDAPCRYMFVKSIFSCITNLFAKSCTLSRREKRDYVRTILATEQVHERAKGAFGGLSVKGLCLIMRTRLVWLNMLAFRAVAFAGEALPGLFMTLKHKK